MSSNDHRRPAEWVFKQIWHGEFQSVMDAIKAAGPDGKRDYAIMSTQLRTWVANARKGPFAWRKAHLEELDSLVSGLLNEFPEFCNLRAFIRPAQRGAYVPMVESG